MDRRKIKEYILIYKDKDNYKRPCFMEGLIYNKAVYTFTLCNICKFNLSNKYNHILCYVADKRTRYKGEE